MFFNAENRTLEIDGTNIDYVVFGKGKKNMILIPGLGDGLRTMKGMALPIALSYHAYAKTHRVYVFSRKNKMAENYTTREMANDIIRSMQMLGIEKADVVGVSQGGMIAQWMAIDHGELIDKLVLVVTCARSNEMIKTSIAKWKKMAKEGNHEELMKDNVLCMYSDAYIKRNLWITPIIAKLTKPKNYDRFMVMADACVSHNCYDYVDKIKAETLIMGGKLDKVVGFEGSLELNEKILNSKLITYEKWGHALYDEEKTFNSTIVAFLK